MGTRRFITEDDLDTFEGWLTYQAVDQSALVPEELEIWRGYFEEAKQRSANSRKVGLMKLRREPGEYLYAVAIRQDSKLWLALWVRRSQKGDIFVLKPQSASDWDPHTSYHRDGRVHSKSYGKVVFPPNQRQPLTPAFRGTELLVIYAGFGTRSVGAECDPVTFSGIVEVPSGLLGVSDGVVIVDLVEPGCEPVECYREIVLREYFREGIPWIVITVAR